MAEISKTTVSAAALLKPGITHSSNGVGESAVDNFEKILVDDELSMETVNKVMEALKLGTEAFVLAGGEVAQETLVANKDINDFTVSMPIGKHASVDLQYQREIERRKSVTDPTMVKVQGATSVKFNFKPRNSAEMKRVRASLAVEATKLFG
jgi:hypothetical protein